MRTIALLHFLNQFYIPVFLKNKITKGNIFSQESKTTFSYFLKGCGEVCKKQRTTPPCPHHCNEYILSTFSHVC